MDPFFGSSQGSGNEGVLGIAVFWDACPEGGILMSVGAKADKPWVRAPVIGVAR